MRSSTVLDRHDTRADQVVTVLLALWQHPISREFHAIGRLSHIADEFVFVYTRGAAEIADFRPLPGLDDLHRRYTSSTLPAVFGQRVMAHGRPDYAKYVRGLGLDPDLATPWEQIVRSGGSRHGDTLQFMAIPHVAAGRARACFLVNGLSHMPETVCHVADDVITVDADLHETALAGLAPGDVVQLRPEVCNTKDPDAILVMSAGVPLGWVPRILAPSLRELLGEKGGTAEVERVGPPRSAPHVRLVLNLDTPAPADFAFDREHRWASLAD